MHRLLSSLMVLALLTGSALAAPPMIGGQRDAHGCLAPAGYTWSELRHTCLRLFEDGIRLDPVRPRGSAVISAFVLFEHGGDSSHAELFVPSSKGSVLLVTRQMPGGPAKWQGGGYGLARVNGVLELSRGGKLLYRQAAR